MLQYTRKPNEIDHRHRAAAMQVKDDGANLKTCTRPSTHSCIGLTFRREKTSEELDRERRRRADIDPRIVLRDRLNAREESKKKSAIAEYAASDPAEKMKLEALRRRDPVNSGIARAQVSELVSDFDFSLLRLAFFLFFICSFFPLFLLPNKQDNSPIISNTFCFFFSFS